MFILTFSFVLILKFVFCGGSDIFHQNSRTTFYPDIPSNYFGYSVLLSDSSLIVGAPKAAIRVNDSIFPGQVFTCRLANLNQKNVTCEPLDKPPVGNFFRNDMWFGAAVATTPEGNVVACAPRWANMYGYNHFLAYGACYLASKTQRVTMIPLNDRHRLAWLTDGARKEYGEYDTNLNFYAYGMAGMSIKVTNNNRIVIGAPGLMQWTGGVIDYGCKENRLRNLACNKVPVANTYFTKDLGPDNYFGYSVESGVFEVNGSTLYVAGAPRSKGGLGQVLLFEPPIREQDPLNVRGKVSGSQLGSYFGAALCCTDLNGDGIDDLLVGAPNFVVRKDDLPYDQGAVFVYLAGASTSKVATIILKGAGHVSGMGQSGARFGSAIAALGDVDADGYNDIAVGAPWESDGLGAVYIYKGSVQGLRSQYVQRILADDARGFGISISKGLDVDANTCNDLAVGAFNSATAYVFRCIPTITVHASIKVPDAMSLPVNVSSFLTEFCLKVDTSRVHGEIDLKASITIDPDYNRAWATQEEYKVTVKTSITLCKEQEIQVLPTANLSRPVMILMELEPMAPLIDDSLEFRTDSVRLSENSTLRTSLLIQLMRDCGEDLVCTPLLILTLDAIESTFIPGNSSRLGVRITVLNKEEPAYDVKVYIRLPLPPRRIPRLCTLEGVNMICDVPSPLNRGEFETWEVEVEHSLHSVEPEIITFEAELRHPLYIRSHNENSIKDVNITVVPKARFKISGKSMPNNTITITRENFDAAGNVSFAHYYEITNLGPSDWISLTAAVLVFPENVTVSALSPGCSISSNHVICGWPISANTSIAVAISMKYNLSRYGNYLEELTTFNVTTSVLLNTSNSERLSITTKLVLEPAKPLIVIIAVSAVIGLLLLSGIVYGLHRIGFFARMSTDEMRQTITQSEEEFLEPSAQPAPGCSTSQFSEDPDNSSQELINKDSDDSD